MINTFRDTERVKNDDGLWDYSTFEAYNRDNLVTLLQVTQLVKPIGELFANDQLYSNSNPVLIHEPTKKDDSIPEVIADLIGFANKYFIDKYNKRLHCENFDGEFDTPRARNLNVFNILIKADKMEEYKSNDSGSYIMK